MLVDKQNELMSALLFTVQQHGGDDVTWKPPIVELVSRERKKLLMIEMIYIILKNKRYMYILLSKG